MIERPVPRETKAPPGTAGVPIEGGEWRRIYDRLALLALFALLIVVVLTFKDYAITNDEELHYEYGRRLVAFYLSGFADRSAFELKDLYLYGGLFDIAATLFTPLLPLDPYETRHLLGGLVGVLGIAGAWRLARLLAGPRAAFLAAMLFALSASYYGAMFNNPKDVPFAAAMVWFLYYTCRLMPRLPTPRFRHVAMLGVSAGAAFGIKVIAGIGIVYLLAAVLLHLGWVAKTASWKAAAADARAIVPSLLPAAAIAYAMMAVFWPWSVLSPLNPLVAVRTFSDFVFNIDTILAGEKVKMYDVPPYYLASYLLAKLRESTLVGVALAILAAALGTAAWIRGKAAFNRVRATQYALVAFAVAFPLLVYLLVRPTDFNGIRHYYFLLPPIMVAAGVGLDWAWARIEGWRAAANAVIVPALTAVGVVQAATMIELHPHQYVYYNALVGGLEGAEDQYEMDYWSNISREATLELNHFIELEYEGRPVDRTFRVAYCNHRAAAQAYMAPFLEFTHDWPSADFFVSTTHMKCDDQLDGKVIVEVERMDVVLGVVKDRRHILARERPLRLVRP